MLNAEIWSFEAGRSGLSEGVKIGIAIALMYFRHGSGVPFIFAADWNIQPFNEASLALTHVLIQCMMTYYWTPHSM